MTESNRTSVPTTVALPSVDDVRGMLGGVMDPELKANIVSSGRTISETWLYQWRALA